MSASRIADQRDLGQVEALAQQVDADQHVVLAEPQVADDLDPLERVDLGVQVADPEAVLEQVLGQVLGHLLGQGRDQDALVASRRGRRTSFIRSSIWFLVSRTSTSGSTIPVGRTICSTIRVDSARSHGPGRRRDQHQLVDPVEELVELERPVVDRRGQAEAEVDQRLLARAVALVHAADLRDRLVGLVDEADEVVGEVVDQRVRRAARRAAVEDPRVVLDPEAEAELRIISMSYSVRWRSRCASSCLPSLLEARPCSVRARARSRRPRAPSSPPRHVVASPARPRRGRSSSRISPVSGSKCWIASISSPKSCDPVGRLGVGGDRSPAPRRAPGRCRGRALVSLRWYCMPTSLRSSLVAVDPLADLEQLHLLAVELRRADPVDAGDRGDDDHVARGRTAPPSPRGAGGRSRR